MVRNGDEAIPCSAVNPAISPLSFQSFPLVNQGWLLAPGSEAKQNPPSFARSSEIPRCRALRTGQP